MGEKLFFKGMMTVKATIGPSPIHGIGLFAAEPIKKGQVVWRFDPKWDLHFTWQEFERMAEVQQQFLRTYAYFDKSNFILVLCADHARHFNHAPVDRATVIENGETDHAARDIAVGEELTVDYNTFDGWLRPGINCAGQNGGR